MQTGRHLVFLALPVAGKMMEETRHKFPYKQTTWPEAQNCDMGITQHYTL